MTNHLERIKRFMLERPTLAAANKEPNTLIFLLKAEVDELVAAIAHEPTENQHLEWLDIYWFVLSIALLWEIDIDAVFNAKATVNELKYRPEDFQDGDYETARLLSRKRWEEKHKPAEE